MLTENERKVLKLILYSFDTDFSVNQIAKHCSLSPNGAYKILKKFENQKILKPTKIANIKSYKLNFKNEKTTAILELTLITELHKKLKYRLEDFKELKEIIKACIIFGSYINPKKIPNDLDVLFIIDKKDYKNYKKRLIKTKQIIPVKIHDIIQTKEDLKQKIIKKDKVIQNILKKGIILWGQKTIIEIIENAGKR